MNKMSWENDIYNSNSIVKSAEPISQNKSNNKLNDIQISETTSAKVNRDYGYEELFSIKAPFNPSDKNLDGLAAHTTEKFDTSESRIPSGYTYLSQFITHDISLDSENETPPWNIINSAAVYNKSTPFFDLETIYGPETSSDPSELLRAGLMEDNSKLKLGKTIGDSTGNIYTDFPYDLPRKANSPVPNIVDLRNDENLVVAQTQVAFTKFHNAIVDHLGGNNTSALFDKARRIAIRHYQWIVLHDFLPRVVKKSVLDDVIANNNRFYFADPLNPRIPLEFAFAAFRFGHSMVRDAYQWNRVRPRASLSQLARFTHFGGGLKSYNRLPSAWIINWNWFYDIDNSMNTQKTNFNFARKIDSLITKPLGKFRDPLALKFYRENSLPAFDLYRNRALGLPNGQRIVQKIQEKIPVPVISAEKMSELLPESIKGAFKDETPLWFYILAEAQIEAQENTAECTLGTVGSRIVAETVIELLKYSPFSILTCDLATDENFLGINGKFGMPEMLKFIASKNSEFDELNPTEKAS